MGKELSRFDQHKWKTSVKEWIKSGILAKFLQNPDIQDILLENGNRVIGVANPNDTFFGIGLHLNDEMALNPENWNKSKNLMGEILCEIREEIREVKETLAVSVETK